MHSKYFQDFIIRHETPFCFLHLVIFLTTHTQNPHISHSESSSGTSESSPPTLLLHYHVPCVCVPCLSPTCKADGSLLRLYNRTGVTVVLYWLTRFRSVYLSSIWCFNVPPSGLERTSHHSHEPVSTATTCHFSRVMWVLEKMYREKKHGIKWKSEWCGWDAIQKENISWSWGEKNANLPSVLLGRPPIPSCEQTMVKKKILHISMSIPCLSFIGVSDSWGNC